MNRRHFMTHLSAQTLMFSAAGSIWAMGENRKGAQYGISAKNTRRVTRIGERTLEEIRAILTLANQDKLAEAKKTLLKEGSVKLRIYDLCDGTKTTKDIATAIQKDLGYVNSYLSILRREGLIRTVEREGKQVHEQIF